MWRVAVLVDEGSRPFDIGVTQEVFTGRAPDQVDLAVVATAPAVSMAGGWTLNRTATSADGADLVVIPGRVDPLSAPPASLVGAVRQASDAGAEVASLCVGAFVLGAAGLLDGREATTHWRYASELARRFPRSRVLPDALYAGGDGVWSSAGVSAGTDLLLHLVRRQLGAHAAAEIARSMVTPAFRPGSQAQFMAGPRTEPQAPAVESLQAAVEAAPQHNTAAPSADTSQNRTPPIPPMCPTQLHARPPRPATPPRSLALRRRLRRPADRRAVRGL